MEILYSLQEIIRRSKTFKRGVSMKQDIVIIGGGPAGMAAALAAYDKGIFDVLIL